MPVCFSSRRLGDGVTDAEGAPEENTGVATDLVNAYNSLDRDKMLEALYAEPRLEPIFRLVDWAYSSPTNLYIVGNYSLCKRHPSGGPFWHALVLHRSIGPH